MGTSNIYNGPKDKKSKHGQTNETLSWRELKSFLTRFISSNSGTPKKLLANYVKCLGGNNGALLKSKAGLISGGNLIDFINLMQEIGLEKTLESYDIEYKDKQIEVVLSELINKLSPNSATKEDCISRMAMSDTLSYFYSYIELNHLDIKILNSIDEALIAKLLTIFFASYVFNKFMVDLESRFDRSKEEYQKLSTKENDIKSLINSIVDISISKMNLSKKIENPQEISRKLLNDCYQYLEVLND